MDGDAFLLEMLDAILGDHYPTPDRMLTLTERIVHKYLEQEMLAEDTSIGKFDLFTTEGGTAAMDYIFTSLLENKILHKGDKIALGTLIHKNDDVFTNTWSKSSPSINGYHSASFINFLSTIN